MKLQAGWSCPPLFAPIGYRIAELHDGVNWPYERNSNGERWCRGTCSLCRLMERTSITECVTRSQLFNYREVPYCSPSRCRRWFL